MSLSVCLTVVSPTSRTTCRDDSGDVKPDSNLVSVLAVDNRPSINFL